MKHMWVCEDCGEEVLFSQPELPQDDPDSEQNDEMECSECGGDMFFEEYS